MLDAICISPIPDGTKTVSISLRAVHTQTHTHTFSSYSFLAARGSGSRFSYIAPWCSSLSLAFILSQASEVEAICDAALTLFFKKCFLWTSLSLQISQGTNYLPAHKKPLSNPPHSHVTSLISLLKSGHVIFPLACRLPCYANDYEIKFKTIHVFSLSLIAICTKRIQIRPGSGPRLRTAL